MGLPREDEYIFTRLRMTLYALGAKNDFPGVENIFPRVVKIWCAKSKNTVVLIILEFSGGNKTAFVKKH